MEICVRILFVAACLIREGFSGAVLEKIHEWKELDFQFTSDSARERYIRIGDFIPGNAVPIDVDTWQNGDDNRIFMTIPKFKDGIPASLVTVSTRDSSDRGSSTRGSSTRGSSNRDSSDRDSSDRDSATRDSSNRGSSNRDSSNSDSSTRDSSTRGSYNRGSFNRDPPLLKPYPDWSWHVPGNCDGLTSVFRTQIDQCGRLWAIDSGMVDLFKSPRRRLCQPQLVAFNLETNKPSLGYKFPNSVLSDGSILANVAIDVRDSRNRCSDTFAYVADVTGFSIIVYDVQRNNSWRVQSNTMFPYPPQGIFKTNNIEFDLMDGILGLALGPNQNGRRNLFYHSFASVRESWVPTTVLKNESIYSTGFNTAPREFRASEEARPSQSAPQAFDSQGVLYFAPVAENAIYCWNSQDTFKSQNLHEIVRDNDDLQFTTGLKVVQPNNRDEELWVLTTRFHLVMVDQLRRNEVNFRILKGKLSDLTRESPCEKDRPISFPQYTQRPGSEHGHGHGRPHTHGNWNKDKNRRPGYGPF